MTTDYIVAVAWKQRKRGVEKKKKKKKEREVPALLRMHNSDVHGLNVKWPCKPTKGHIIFTEIHA